MQAFDDLPTKQLAHIFTVCMSAFPFIRTHAEHERKFRHTSTDVYVARQCVCVRHIAGYVVAT